MRFGDLPDKSRFEIDDSVYQKVGELYQEFNDDGSKRGSPITAEELSKNTGYTEEELAEVELTIVD